CKAARAFRARWRKTNSNERSDPRVKIAYLSHSPLLTQVANAIHVMQMCDAFASHGHEVSLYARGRSRRARDLFRAYGLEPGRFKIALLPRGTLKILGRSTYALMQ